MSMYGYAGNVLHVDLSSGEIRQEALDPELARKFVGGFGLNAHLAWDLIKPGTDPLSPDNPIIVGAGPFLGAPITGTSKVMGTTKLPTGAIGTGSGGMRFGPTLKWAGYDHLIVTGQAKGPVYLKVFDNQVEICDAGDLWGKDLYDATDALWNRYGKECSVAAIGQAGENRVGPSLALIDKIGHWMRGAGAVWGSKNLKAIVVRGTRGIRAADAKRFTQLTDQLIERSKNYKHRQEWVDWGLMRMWDMFVMFAEGMPVKNNRELYPAKAIDERYGRRAIMEQMDKIPIGCPSCTASDKHILRMKGGDFAGFTAYYSTIFGCFGCGPMSNVDFGQVLKHHDHAQRYGLDMLTTNSMIAWAIDLFDQGVITIQDTDGLLLNYDYDNMMRMYDLIANREGFGDILAGGWDEAIERLGKDSGRYAVTVKGSNPPLDGRMSFGTDTLSGMISPRAQVARGGSPTLLSAAVPTGLFEKWARKVGIPDEAWNRVFTTDPPVNIARATKYAEDWMSLFDCLGICGRATTNRLYSTQTVADLYSSLTGYEVSAEELLKGAERAFNLERALNVREGLTRKDDRIPERWLNEPIKGKDSEIWLQDFYRTGRIDAAAFDQMLDDYYDERGWDLKTGIPTKENLSKLGLEEFEVQRT